MKRVDMFLFQAVVEKLHLSDGASECFYLFETVEYNFGKYSPSLFYVPESKACEWVNTFEPQHEISMNVVGATTKASD